MPEEQDKGGEQTLRQDGSVAMLDAPEGLPSAGEPLDSTSTQSLLETPENAPDGKNITRKSRKKWVTIIVILGILILAGVGAFVCLSWGVKKDENVAIENTGEKEDGENGDDEGDKKGEADQMIEAEAVIVLDVNDPLVQGSFQNFEAVGYSVLEKADFYHTFSTELPQAVKEGFVINSMGGTKYLGLLNEAKHRCEDGGMPCYYDAEVFLARAREMFGADMTFADGPIGMEGCGNSATYLSETHEVSYGSGCGGAYPGIHHRLYHAEIVGDELRIDEAAAVTRLRDSQSSKWGLYSVDENKHIRDTTDFSDDWEERFYDGWETWDKYRWIFRRDEAGNFVFKTLERRENE